MGFVTDHRPIRDLFHAFSSAKVTAKMSENKDETEHIRLKVVGPDSKNEVYFRVKMSTQMGKLKKSYAEKIGIPTSFLRFLFDGRRIHDDETPKAHEMKQDDIIEVYGERIGAAGRIEEIRRDYTAPFL